MSPLRQRIVDAIVALEDRLDRLKLGYKERFDRFDAAAIVPYRGYGRPDLLRITGRILEDTETGFQPGAGRLGRARNTIRRLETDEIRHALLRATFGGVERLVRADGEAYFEIHIEPEEPVEPGWHDVRLEIVDSMASETAGPAFGPVLVPPDHADFIVVSDLDDTVVRTGAADRVSMMSTVLLNDAHSREPFEGVGSLYAALEAGPGGAGANPVFYLSRSARNLYEMLEGFLDHRGLPRGPILLADYGLRDLLGGDDRTFKADTLHELFAFYPDHAFVLVGDSGQKDPELFLDVVRAHPGRVRAVIVRDVTAPERDREVRGIAEGIEAGGVPVIVAEESGEAALRAADLGLVHPDRLTGGP